MKLPPPAQRRYDERGRLLHTPAARTVSKIEVRYYPGEGTRLDVCAGCGRAPFARSVGQPSYLYRYRTPTRSKGYVPAGPVVCSLACHDKALANG